MSIASYSDLKTAVQRWVRRTDLSAYAADIVRVGEWRIYRDLRIRAMETALSSTIASGVIAVPSDYVEMKYCYVDGSPTQFLQRRKAEYIYEKYSDRSSTSKPVFFARESTNFIFGPYPDSGYTINGIYYKRLNPLSDSNTTNWFTTNAPDLLLFACLAEMEPFLRNDDRIPLWEAKYKTIAAQVQKEDDSENHSGSAPTVAVSWR
jgi:hypothetical protein